MHIVVVDEDGKASGIAVTFLKNTYIFQKQRMERDNLTEEVYYKNYLANKSEYMFAGAHQME